MSSHQIELCISIVSGSNRQMTWDCLHSLLASLDDDLDCQIHFIDNASPPDHFAGVHSLSQRLHVHRNEQRKGFGANHNMIMRQVNARYYLLLNDDTLIFANCCQNLLAAAKRHPEAGFLGAKLFNPDKSIQESVYPFPSLRKAFLDAFMLDRFFGSPYRKFDYSKESFVDVVCGAAIVADRKMLDQIGLLDEGFFMYAEETDWCLRAQKAGWRTLFVPDAQLIHFGGQSTTAIAPERSVEFLRSYTRLIKKNYGKLSLPAFKLLNLIKHLPRLIRAILLRMPESKILAEKDTVLWSLGLLKRSGLSELAAKQSSTAAQPARALQG